MGKIDFGIRKPVDFSPLSEKILDETIIPQFERTVEKFSNQPAIKDFNSCLSYRELNNAINNLAKTIGDLVGKPKRPIAFLNERELMSIISMMAIAKIGGISVGLHPSNSVDQLRDYLVDSTAELIITSSKFRSTINALRLQIPELKVIFFDQPEITKECANPGVVSKPEDVFGIFYTSGSTGKPKGVMIGHLYKSQSIHYQTNGWFFSPSDRISLVTSSCYLASHPSIFGAFLNGGLLCIFDLHQNSAKKALNWIIDEKLTVFRSTPSIFRNIITLAPKDLKFPYLRFITLGGELVTNQDIDLFKLHTLEDCTLVNNYSSTEAGAICHYPIHHDLPSFEGMLPAGYPAPGKEVLLIDENGKNVAIGEVGEVVVRSKYLNLGYWRQEDLTALKYSTDPMDSEYRYCNSGDLGKFRNDGILEIVGRKDTQVKIRGFRIQLEIVDLALRSLPGVRDAATVVFGNVQGGERLAAYLVTDKKSTLTVNQIRLILADKIPGYMIPSRFIFMEQLPRTQTGKLSRNELPTPTNERPELSTAFVAPKSNLEIEIANIWKEMLGFDDIGIADNFFDLGGDSLLILQMSLAVEAATGRSFPQEFFKEPTIQHLCEMLEDTEVRSIENEKFLVKGIKDSEVKNIARKHKKKSILDKSLLIIKKLVRRSEPEWLYRILDKKVGEHFVSMPYQKALSWGVRWSNNPFVRNLLYSHRKKLFTKWQDVLGEGNYLVSGTFQQNLLTNMFFFIPKATSKFEKDPYALGQSFQKSSIPFWRTLGKLIVETPTENITALFPMEGLEYIQEARNRGKGVILLSFHGNPHPGGFLPLAKVLKVEGIPTISYLIPIRQSGLHDSVGEITELEASSLNAEIALYGQKILQQGGVVNFASDTNDHSGKTYNVAIGNRNYQIKGGFAEMALNTGASIVPFNRYCLEDGRIKMEFFPPMEIGEGTREEIVERLVREYGAFIENCWRTHSDGISWARINRHLEQKHEN